MKLRRVMRCTDCGQRATKERLSKYAIFRDTFMERLKVWTHADSDYRVPFGDERPHAFVGLMKVRFDGWEIMK